MLDMPTEKHCINSSHGNSARLLGAIEKVRLQKQRPSVERIHRVLRQLDPDLSMAAVGLELEKAAKDGTILKVVTNNLCSYKLLPSGSSSKPQTSSLPVLHVLPSQEFLDVIVSLVGGLNRCSLEVLENQVRRKYALEVTGDLNLRQELRDCCRKLVKLGQLRKDGMFFCLPPGDTIRAADSVADANTWKNATICLQDCSFSMAMSSTTLSSGEAGDRFEGKPGSRGSDGGKINSYGATSGYGRFDTGAPLSASRPVVGDLYTFLPDPAPETPVKLRQKSSVVKSSLHVEPEIESAKNPKLRKELASCDSTTSLSAQDGKRLKESLTAQLESRSLKSRASGGRWDDDSSVNTDDVEQTSEEKPKKRSRSLQLAFLYDSLSKFFTATGTKRSTVQKSAPQQNRPSDVANGVVHSGSRSEPAVHHSTRTLRTTLRERQFPSEGKQEKTSANFKAYEKSKPIQLKVKKANVSKELYQKQGHPQQKSGGASDVYTSPITEEESKLFDVAQTIAHQRALVNPGCYASEAETKRTRTRVVFGKYEITSSERLPYPPEYSVLPRIYVCEMCVKCFKTRTMLERHLRKCCVGRPPGEELYHDNSLSVFEVQGSKEPIYCRNLILFARLFLDHPGLHCRVSQCVYYVALVSDRNGSHLIGFFSKEKFGEHSLACLLILPQYRGKGYGHFMVHLSYWLSSTDEIQKSPKPPLTDPAKRIYYSVWKKAVADCIEREDLTEITVPVISCLTGIRDEDVLVTLRDLGLMHDDDSSHNVIKLTRGLRDIVQIKVEDKRRPVELNPNAFIDSRLTRKLRGKHRAVKRGSTSRPDNLSLDSAKRKRTTLDWIPKDKTEVEEAAASQFRTSSDEFDLSLSPDPDPDPAGPPKRRVGWPKGLKRGSKQEKSPTGATEVIYSKEQSTKVDAAGCLEKDEGKTEWDGEKLKVDDKKLESEETDVSTSVGVFRYHASTPASLKSNENRDDEVEDEDLLLDHGGSTISEMPNLDEKNDNLQNSDNELEFGRSPSPPQLEQELPSPYFCSGSYLRHELDMASKDAESVLSDFLAGRSIAPSPCFSIDEPRLRKERDEDSESNASAAASGSGEKEASVRSGSYRRGSLTPHSLSEGINSNFAASRSSSSSDTADENSLSSAGFSRSSSVESLASVRDKSSLLGSPGSNKGKLSSDESLGLNLDKSPVGSPESVQCSLKGKLSSVESPSSVRDKLSLVESPGSVVGKVSSADSPGSLTGRLSSAASPAFIRPKSSSAESPGSVRCSSAKSINRCEVPEQVLAKESNTRGQSGISGHPETGSPSNPAGDEDLSYDRSSVLGLPPCPLPCSSDVKEKKDAAIRNDGSSLASDVQGSILPPVSRAEHRMDGSCVKQRSVAAENARVCHDVSLTSQRQGLLLGHASMASHISMSSHGYLATGQSAVTSPQMNQSAQLVKHGNVVPYENSEAGQMEVNIARQQHYHQALLKVGPGMIPSENSLESSPILASSAPRTFPEPAAPPSVLVEDRSPLSFQLQNGLSAKAAKAGSNVPSAYPLGNEVPSNAASSSRVHAAHQVVGNSPMVGQCSVATLSPGFMNSMTPSPMTKGMANQFGTSKSSAVMASRGNSGRLCSSQVAPPGGNFGGHQQMSKQMMSNKYSKAPQTPNTQLQNLSQCGLYGLPKSSPSTGVQQGMSNSSPNVNYTAVANLSPSSSECVNASFHSLAAHNRNLVNASPAPSCSGKPYGRNLQNSGSRGFSSGAAGASSPSPKPPSVNTLYQLPPSQNMAPSPHQIQTPTPYAHGAVQRHINEQFPSGSESFSRQQGYMFQATYLAKLQQLTNDLHPFQTHYTMALPPNMSPSPIDMTLPSHASPQRNMTPPNIPTQRLSTKQQVHRGNGNSQHKSGAAASSFLPDMPGSDMIARYQLLSGYSMQQPMTCPSFIHQGSPPQIPMQVGVMNVGMHPGQPSPNFMPGMQGQPNSAVYAAYGYINGGLTPQTFNMNLNDLMRR